MEMRKEAFKIIEDGTEIDQLEFEQFINESFAGLNLIDELCQIEFKTIEQIKEELNLNDIYEVYYIEELVSVRLVLTNGCQHLLMRV
ncbi:hypothetical protein [Clostridium beijerinckii]|uniref:hypothetical protein n=1 Tax=Clostridium beijerinckii TaxID=1520 RepID=UPI00156FA5CC|nr:hypothetical protein [Clostridium beijerinckii]NRU52435.1 hypothetical protein [Clostridium beijerinckii]NYC69120.1 hypothetical protein [Clostridium beijerinckii]